MEQEKELKVNQTIRFAYKFLEDLQEKPSNDTLTALASIFGQITLQEALKLLDDGKFVEVRTNQAVFRHIYRVSGKSRNFFTIYENLNYCQCENFKLNVWQNKQLIMCEHVLAVKLNTVLNLNPFEIDLVTDSQFCDFLNEQLNCISVDGAGE